VINQQLMSNAAGDVRMAKSGVPLGEWSGSDATKTLQATIEKYQAESSRQTGKMIFLTWVIAALTVVMAVGVAVQIYLTLYPPR
jgi:hypothetical protein